MPFARRLAPLGRYRALFARYLRPQARRVSLLGGLLLGSIALQLTFPQILSRFVDAAREGAALETLAAIGGIYLLVTAVLYWVVAIWGWVREVSE